MNRHSKHTNDQRYSIIVMFLHGIPESKIARTLTLYKPGVFTKGTISGVLNRAGVRNLSLAERQEHLDELLLHRTEDSKLPDSFFTAKSRDGRGGK